MVQAPAPVDRSVQCSALTGCKYRRTHSDFGQINSTWQKTLFDLGFKEVFTLHSRQTQVVLVAHSGCELVIPCCLTLEGT